ncbi:winged helix-turn-helix transcriptional regulator [Syntrophomonas wolfei]|jgi:sugar/nucleoside kinase (ribokinase family)|uniref:winged helix-turn-helix transcriptional regulator n=1 Tax=Syntrophomonas wolfei TaxID=863 RepID=UPI0007737347|nr:PfkB family carbohydrate kinase [Syntrophomonas wolfei]
MRLTSREKEIFEVLKKEPLISQEELARRFNITRSSIAVHISNLMKKGVILGKGYVFNEQVSVVVIGESYYYIKTSGPDNDCSINMGLGGFAVDIGRIFANFGLNVKLITIIGNDDEGTNILNVLQGKGIDTVNIFRHAKKRSCRKVFLKNDKRILEENFSLHDYGKAIDAREWVVFNCEWLAVETKFQELMFRKAMGKDEEKLPFLCTYRYLDSMEEIPDFLSRYDLLVLGAADGSILEHYLSQVLALSSDRVQSIVLSDGNTRLLYFQKGNAHEFPLLPNQCFNSQEGLPALLAGIVYGLSNGYSLRQAVRIAVGTAASND